MTRWGRFGRENALSYVPRRTSHGSAGTGVDLHCPRLALLDRHTQGDAAAGRPPLAPVAQWIEQRFPKPRAQVRFLSGALLRLDTDRPRAAQAFSRRVQR